MDEKAAVRLENCESAIVDLISRVGSIEKGIEDLGNWVGDAGGFEELSAFRRLCEEQQAELNSLLDDCIAMQDKIDERDIMLLVHRDGMAVDQAIASFANANDRPIHEVEKLVQSVSP